MNKDNNNIIIKHNPPALSILYWNADSIMNKLSQLTQFIENETNARSIIHFIAIGEAKLSKNQSAPILQTAVGTYQPYYFKSFIDIERDEKKEEGQYASGGLLVYIHNTIQHVKVVTTQQLQYIVKSTISASDLGPTDTVWFDIKYGRSNLRIGLVYLHPQFTRPVFEALLNNIKFNMDGANGKVIIGGDFNLKHPSWSCHHGATYDMGSRLRFANEFNELIDEQGLVLLNTIYAHYVPTLEPRSKGKASTVDLVLANSPTFCMNLQVLNRSGLLSDHEPILVQLINKSAQQQSNQTIQNRKCFKWASSKMTSDSWLKFAEELAPALEVWHSVYGELITEAALQKLVIEGYGKSTIQSLIQVIWKSLQSTVINVSDRVIGKKAVGLGNKPQFTKHKEELMI